MHEPYQHSGSLGLAPILGPALLIPASVFLAGIYAVAVVYIPIPVVVSFFSLAGLVIALTWSVGVTVRLVKSRNVWLNGALGGLAGVSALYASWVFFLWLLLSRSASAPELGQLDLAVDPAAVWALMVRVNEVGWFALGDATVRGWPLALAWIVEAMVIIGLPILKGFATIADDVFCEPCGSWAETAAATPFFQLPTDPEEARRLRFADISELERAPFPTDTTHGFLVGKVLLCPKCERTTALRLDQRVLDRKENGELEQDDLLFSLLWNVSRSDGQRILEIAARQGDSRLPDPEAPEPTDESHSDDQAR